MFQAMGNGAVPAGSDRAELRKMEAQPRPRHQGSRRRARVLAAECPYCAMPRLRLRSARVAAKWVNIWEDRAAAAQVRAITGDETVPTVTVGTQTMVNAPARQVIAAVRAGDILAGEARPRRGARG
jgi:mycoredoxin